MACDVKSTVVLAVKDVLQRLLERQSAACEDGRYLGVREAHDGWVDEHCTSMCMGMSCITTAARTRGLRHGTAATLGSAHLECDARCKMHVFRDRLTYVHTRRSTLHKGL